MVKEGTSPAMATSAPQNRTLESIDSKTRTLHVYLNADMPDFHGMTTFVLTAPSESFKMNDNGNDVTLMPPERNSKLDSQKEDPAVPSADTPPREGSMSIPAGDSIPISTEQRPISPKLDEAAAYETEDQDQETPKQEEETQKPEIHQDDDVANIHSPIVGVKPGPPLSSGRTAARGGPSRFRGVVWHKSNCKWEARIYEGGKQKFLGYFVNELAAAMAYDDHAVRLHGNLSKLNFPERYEGVNLPPPLRPPAASKGGGGGAGNGSRAPRMRPVPSTDGVNALAAAAALNTSEDNAAQKAPQLVIRPSPTGGAAPTKGSSRYRGVSWNSNCGKWRAQVWKGSEVHHLGYFENEEDAAIAYDEAALRMRGVGAPTNFPLARYDVRFAQDDTEKIFQRFPPAAAAAIAATAAAQRAKLVDGAGNDTQGNAAPVGAAGAATATAATPTITSTPYGGAFPPGNSSFPLHHPRPGYQHHPNAVDEIAGSDNAFGAPLYPRAMALPGSTARMGPTPPPSAAVYDSRCHGVSWSPGYNAWIAEIWDGVRYRLLGRFTTEDEAARAYDIACISEHGINAITNYPLSMYETELAALALRELAGEHLLTEESMRVLNVGLSTALTSTTTAANGWDTKGLSPQQLPQQQHRALFSNPSNAFAAYTSNAATLSTGNLHSSNSGGLALNAPSFHAPQHYQQHQHQPSGTATPPLGNPITSHYVGITWDGQKQRWLSQIHQHGQRHFLGYFESEAAAAAAYDAAAIRLIGPSATLNFPEAAPALAAAIASAANARKESAAAAAANGTPAQESSPLQQHQASPFAMPHYQQQQQPSSASSSLPQQAILALLQAFTSRLQPKYTAAAGGSNDPSQSNSVDIATTVPHPPSVLADNAPSSSPPPQQLQLLNSLVSYLTQQQQQQQYAAPPTPAPAQPIFTQDIAATLLEALLRSQEQIQQQRHVQEQPQQLFLPPPPLPQEERKNTDDAEAPPLPLLPPPPSTSTLPSDGKRTFEELATFARQAAAITGSGGVLHQNENGSQHDDDVLHDTNNTSNKKAKIVEITGATTSDDNNNGTTM